MTLDVILCGDERLSTNINTTIFEAVHNTFRKVSDSEHLNRLIYCKNTKSNINCLYLKYLSDTGKCNHCQYPKQLPSNLDNSDYSHLSLSLSLSLSLLIMNYGLASFV